MQKTGGPVASMRSEMQALILVLLVAGGVWPAQAWARSMAVMESFPMVDQIMDGSATPFSIRFDGPIDHARSRLILITPKGTQALHPRLDSEPNTLFSPVGRLAPGNYELRWEVRAMDGERSSGTVPFKVAPR